LWGLGQPVLVIDNIKNLKIMKRTVIITLAIWSCMLSHLSLAQPDRQQANDLSKNCSCSATLNQTIDKVSRIYAGFDDKVTPQTRPQYEKLVQQVRKQANQAKTQADCHAVLKSYAAFFKDSHVFVIWQQSASQPVLYADAVKDKTDLVDFKVLDDKFIYVKLAVFNQREVDKLDSLLRANAGFLASTPNLIFDLRGNGGGNTSTSDEMAKLIYTNPIVYPAWDYRSSAEFIESTAKNLDSYRKDTVANAYFYKKYKRLLAGLKANPGGMVRDGDDLVRTIDAEKPANPQRIAFLIDKGCGSATEFFVFEGKQSKKVTVFGTNTHGVMDYGEDQNIDLCDGTFNLAVPWGRNGWTRQYRIDNVGFAPDVKIPATEKDWIAFVRSYYSK
jgi:hypothetical protein